MACDKSNQFFQCPVCSEELAHTIPYLNEAFQHVAEFQNLEIAICSHCGLGVTSPERPWHMLKEFYRSVYREPGSPCRSCALPINDRSSVNTRALSQWMLLKAFRSIYSSDSFCDIGPGGGATFETARFLGLNMKMFAFEPDESSKKTLRNLGVEVFEEVFHPESKLGPARFSTIIMSHLLEHFSGSDSVKVFQKLKSMLTEDGILLCEVPNSPMGDYGQMRTDDSPHLTFWTVDALQSVVQRSGMAVLYLSTTGRRHTEVIEMLQRRDGKTDHDSQAIVKSFISSEYCPDILGKMIIRLGHLAQNRTAYDILSDPSFQYGKDRENIRVICSPLAQT